MKKKKSIFTKILLLMILVSVIAGSLMLVIALRNQNKTFEGTLIHENRILAKIVSQSIEAGYFAQQWPFETLEQINECKDILFWWIVKPDGEIYLADDSELWGKRIDEASLGTTSLVIKDSFYKNEKIKLIIHPLNMGDERPWELYLGVSLRSITAARNKMLALSLGLFILIIIFASIFSFYLASSVTRPLRKLTEACDKISMGNFRVKIKAESEDEIGQLAKSFKRMVTSLKILMKEIK